MYKSETKGNSSLLHTSQPRALFEFEDLNNQKHVTSDLGKCHVSTALQQQVAQNNQNLAGTNLRLKDMARSGGLTIVIEVLFSLIGRKARTPGRLGCSHGARSLHACHQMKRIRSSSGCNLIGYTVLMCSDGATGNDCAILKSNVPGCSMRFVGFFIYL